MENSPSITGAELTSHLDFKPIYSEFPGGLLVRIPGFYWQDLDSWIKSLVGEIPQDVPHRQKEKKKLLKPIRSVLEKVDSDFWF